MNHTPGPWEVRCFQSGTVYVHMRNASGKAGPAIVGTDFSDQDGHVGAHMFLHNVPAFTVLTGESEVALHAEKIANARLIAAAPELLELAKMAYENLDDDIENKPMRHSCGRLIAGLRAAIAKAEGKATV